MKKTFNLSLMAALLAATPAAWADDPATEKRIEQLENTLQGVMEELRELRKERAPVETQREAEERTEEGAKTGPSAMEPSAVTPGKGYHGDGYLQRAVDAIPGEFARGVRLGAYGEHHFNVVEGKGGDKSDIHRFVIFLGYDFADWAHLVTELEIEHGLVAEDAGGEVEMEQFHIDLNILPELNLRVGRALHPAGIINRFHEPTTFYGVERPTFSTVVLPSTWSIDGAGLWGKLGDYVSYEAFVFGGLEGDAFTASNGIRGGRNVERPSLRDLGYAGRLDFYPLANVEGPADLRFGGSYSYVGTDNGNNGNADDGVPGNVQIVSGDLDFRLYDFEFRGEIAYLNNRAADKLVNGTADEIFGYYVQGAYHIWPDAWKTGRLDESDLVVFARYDASDTQFSVPSRDRRDRSFDRTEGVFGLSFYPVQRLVLKADVTIPGNGRGQDLPKRMDLGFGYDF